MPCNMCRFIFFLHVVGPVGFEPTSKDYLSFVIWLNLPPHDLEHVTMLFSILSFLPLIILLVPRLRLELRSTRYERAASTHKLTGTNSYL